MKQWAIISFTSRSNHLARQIAEGMPASYVEVTRYCYDKHTMRGAVPFAKGSDLMTKIFGKYDCILFICACGIAVRLIAPHMHHKYKDPAVLVADETGKHVISLLSGHVGGANAYAEQVASMIGAQPVITTATDMQGVFAPDIFAIDNRLYNEDHQMTKEIAACVAAGDPVGFYSKLPVRGLPEYLHTIRSGFPSKKYVYGICIAYEPVDICERTWHLIPKDIIIGAGCRKGTDPAVFERVILGQLEAHQIDIRRVRLLTSVDLKQKEQAFREFSDKYKIPFVYFSAERLMQVPGEFHGSEFVRKMIGVDNVCERSAMESADHLIVPKYCEAGITFAAAKVDMKITFSRA